NTAPGHPVPPTPAAPSSNGKSHHTPSGISAPDPTPQMVRRHESGVVSPVEKLKLELHRKLIDRLDLAALERITDETVLIAQIRQAVSEFLRNETTPLSAAEREQVVEQLVWEVTGLGPLEPLMKDLTISDILVNGPKDVYVERRGRLS